MLYPSLNQPFVIACTFCIGVLSGLIFDGMGLLAKICKKIKFANIFFDFLAVIFSFFLLIIVNLKINYGQFRFYVLIVFFTAFFLERALSNLLTKKLFYTIVNKKIKEKNMEKKSKKNDKKIV